MSQRHIPAVRTSAATIEPLLVRPREARQLLAIGNTRLYQLIGAGELDSVSNGRARRITLASIKDYIARHLQPQESASSVESVPRRRGRPRKRYVQVDASSTTPLR
jgi:excisionase family DNA binding protein